MSTSSAVPTFLLAILTFTSAGAISSAAPASTAAAPAVEYHAVPAASVVGTGWLDPERPFERLPARAEPLVTPPVWYLSHDSSGEYVEFVTDATSISVRWTLTTKELSMAHMPATGVSGVDLYLQNDGTWHFLANGRATEFPDNEVELVAGLPAKRATYRLYLPLYNGVSKVEVGVPRDAAIELSERPAKSKPVVFYGTSITQGGCASRPGMSYTAILGRRLNVPAINLGFSGSGKAEANMGKLIGEIDAAAFVIDALPNLFAEQVPERLPTFIANLRSSHAETPILLVESPLFPRTPFVADQRKRIEESNRLLRDLHQQCVQAGDQRIILIPACDYTAAGGESTVDGIHPTDLGFVQQADALEPALRKALQ